MLVEAPNSDGYEEVAGKNFSSRVTEQAIVRKHDPSQQKSGIGTRIYKKQSMRSQKLVL